MTNQTTWVATITGSLNPQDRARAAQLEMVRTVRQFCYTDAAGVGSEENAALARRVLDCSIETMIGWVQLGESVQANVNLAYAMVAPEWSPFQ